ncbi:testis-specific serine/threonine-protein kinase 1-like [Protopterus annectens]|uniref:testis-specific serine/threonine-protein kinase 1-like n=1 Tax=Protopterus annectens TaxID=7888 RepID=UPI001CFA435A|nr:testis-specific serine/threonine-protein kinase 1-like [Protopterus annectens]
MDDATVLRKHGYVLGRRLGEGSYGKVKSAYSEQLKTDVAVKIIDKKKVSVKVLKKFLPRELEILRVVNHKNIVKTYRTFVNSNGKIYIVMELAIHGNLREYIKFTGSLLENVAQKMFHQLTMAIKYCHDINIVHRDLKCENLLLDINYNIKLSDFGLSRYCVCDEKGTAFLCETFCGTASYTAPEVLQHIPYQPKTSDIWSMGIILFVMVCGYKPYDASNIRQMIRAQKAHNIFFPGHKCLTPECKELVFCILHPDAMKRLTVEEILSHPWMQPTKPEGTGDKNKDGECCQTEPLQKEQPKTTSRLDTKNAPQSQDKAEGEKIEAKSEAAHVRADAEEITEGRRGTI